MHVRADDPDVVEIDGPPSLEHPAEVVIDALSPIVTPARLARIDEVVSRRTDRIAIVLDAIADPHNASAILRSADAFGIQAVHVILGEHGFRASIGVSKGTHRWLDIHRYRDARHCLERLREEGFHIYAASMDAIKTPEDLAKTGQKLAVVFGNEHRGVSSDVRDHVDGTFAIPMLGFVESLNVSVAAALTVRGLRGCIQGGLSPARELELKARFLMNSVKNATQVIEQSLRNHESHGKQRQEEEGTQA